MPEPSEQELKDNDRDGFIGRCIPMMADEDPNRPHDANIAACFSIWRRAKEAQETE